MDYSVKKCEKSVFRKKKNNYGPSFKRSHFNISKMNSFKEIVRKKLQ